MLINRCGRLLKKAAVPYFVLGTIINEIISMIIRGQ